MRLAAPRPALAAWLGVDLDELLGDASPSKAFVSETDRAALRARFDESAITLASIDASLLVSHPELGDLRLQVQADATRAQDGSTLWHGAVSALRAAPTAASAFAQLAQLINGAPVGLAMFDHDMTYLAASASWEAQFCRGRRGLVGVNHYELHPDLPPRWKDIHRACLAGAMLNAVEDRWDLADGSTMWLRWAVHPWRDDAGQIGGVIMLGEDITARVVAETTLRASEERYRAIVEQSPDVVFINRNGCIDYVNPAALALFGATSPDQLVGRPVLDLITPDDRDRVQARIGEVRKAGTAPRAHIRIRRLDGDERDVETTAASFKDQQGVAIQVVVRDVTEQRRAARALQESEALFRQIAESIREVFWLVDVDGGTTQYVSPAFEAIWGRSVESLYANKGSWLDAVHPDDRERVRDASRPERQIERYDEIYRIVRPDGSVRWIHDKAFPVRDDSGKAVRIAGVAEDITGRRVLEQQLQQAQKMEAIGQLAGGVAHDFNNLLTVIISFAEILQTELGVTSPHAAPLQDILDAGQRGASLTRQLLAFSRQELVEPRVIDLRGVVTETQKMLRRLIGEDVSISVKLPPTPAMVLVDPGQWGQVLMNLALNARDAMPRGGDLDIEISSRGGSWRGGDGDATAGQQVVLSVRDTGCGMTPEVKARMFEPFFTTKERGKGTGLGLAVVYGVVVQSRGFIDVESEPGKGTTYRIHLPAVSGDVASRQLADVRERRGNETILLVEDEDAVRRVVQRTLQQSGYTVVAAASGVEALDIVARQSQPFDLLLTDVVMPELDGSELARQLRELCPDIRVIFMSGYLDDAVLERGLHAEQVAMLQKPFTRAVLLGRLREVLGARYGDEPQKP